LSGKELDPNSAAARPYLMRNLPQENRESESKPDLSPIKISNDRSDDTLQSETLDNIDQSFNAFNDKEKVLLIEQEQSKINENDQVEDYRSTQADEDHQIVTTEEKRNRGRP